MNLSRLTPALALALLPALACTSNPDEIDPEQQLALRREFALRYYDDGDLDRAEQQVDLGLAAAPGDGKLLLMKGWIRQRRGSTQDIFVAEAIFRDLVPDRDYRALLGLAEALERKGVLFWESAAAIESGERHTQAPDPAELAQELRAKAHASWSESIAFYGRTLEEKPGELQAINGLQRTHALSGDFAGSLEWSLQLIDRSKAEIVFWQSQLERPDLTAPEERRLRDLLSSSSDLQTRTHLHASTVLLQLARADEALAHVDEALELDPDEAATYSRRAQLLRRLERTAEAVDAMETFLRLSELGFDHPDVERALELLTTWQREIELANG